LIGLLIPVEPENMAAIIDPLQIGQLFRAMDGYAGEPLTLASTQLNEWGWNDKWVEMQLTHSDHNKVRKVYNHAKYLPQRRAMMPQ
jgi:hypothetical protein